MGFLGIECHVLSAGRVGGTNTTVSGKPIEKWMRKRYNAAFFALVITDLKIRLCYVSQG